MGVAALDAAPYRLPRTVDLCVMSPSPKIIPICDVHYLAAEPSQHRIIAILFANIPVRGISADPA